MVERRVTTERIIKTREYKVPNGEPEGQSRIIYHEVQSTDALTK